jgi:hypothetical protein
MALQEIGDKGSGEKGTEQVKSVSPKSNLRILQPMLF